jgi:hypothetical protein
MSSLYQPPQEESEHLKQHFDQIDPNDPDRMWKGFVIGLLMHLLQPIMWVYTDGKRFSWEPEIVFFTQVLYLVPLSFLLYSVWGIRAFRGVYVLMVTTIMANLGVFVLAIWFEALGLA